MVKLPKDISEKHIIGSHCSEWLISSRQLRTFHDQGVEWAGVSTVRAPYEIVRRRPRFSHLIGVLAGEGEIWLDGSWRAVGPGAIFVNPAEHPEALRASGTKSWNFCWLHVTSGFGPVSVPQRPRIEAREARGLNAAIEGLRLAFHGDWADPLVERWCELVVMSGAALMRGGAKLPRLWRVWDAVNLAIGAAWTIDRLAELAHLSREHLRRVSQAETGRSPMQHVTHLRMQRAINLLLSSDRTVEAVAEAVGYENPFVFSNTFKTWVGERPGAYRKSRGAAAGVVLRPESSRGRFAATVGAKSSQWRRLDLSQVANRTFDHPGQAWFDGEPFPAPPEEVRDLYGVNFRFPVNGATGDRAMLVLKSRITPAWLPGRFQREERLDVDSHAQAIYFLHAAAWAREPSEIASYRIEFADGEVHDAPVISLGEPNSLPPGRRLIGAAGVQDWWPDCVPLDVPQARPVLVSHPSEAQRRSGRIYVFEWRNQRPAAVVKTITIVSKSSRRRATFAILAISVLVPAH